MHDPASNPFQVKWTDLEKTQDIIRFQPRALHLATQYNSGIPILKTASVYSFDNQKIPDISPEIQADIPQSSPPRSIEEDNIVKELHIQYGNLQINMSPACIELQHDLVYKWMNEVHTG